MAIKNPIPKLKKVPKKGAVIAVGGGALIYYVYRAHKNNTGTDVTTNDPSTTDSLSSPSADTYPVSLGQGVAGDNGSTLPAVDFSSGTPSVDGVDGVGAVDDSANGSSDLGTLTLNLVGTPVDGNGATSAPGTGTTNNGKKSVSTKVVKTLADLPYSQRKKIHEERAKGNVDKYGRTPTERAAARANAGVRKQLDQRLQRQRAHKAGGGPTKRQHPKVAHTTPKRSPKRSAPHSHVAQPKQSHPKASPQPAKKRKAKSHA